MKKRIAQILFLLLPSALCLLPSYANELSVDSRRLQRHDLLTITVTLEDSFAGVDSVDVRTRNLVIVGDPWVSTEFAWINGKVVRRKSFRYRARALEAGPGQVGPVTVRDEEGRALTLPAIPVDVMPDRVSGSNDAEIVLRELVALGREPLFVVAEADRKTVYEGEPVTVTWFLYNAATVQQWQVVAMPKLYDFWIEELTRNETPERLYVGDVMMQRLPIRRLALFPLRSGTLRVDGMTVQAAVMRRGRRGPFSMFEGELMETAFTSAAMDITANPIPRGAPIDAVGDLALNCSSPLQRNAGPVVISVTLSGLGNLRAATPPHFEKSIAGTVKMEGGEVSVKREEAFAMERRWRYLVFPAAPGTLEIPPLSMRVFDPTNSARKELRCAASFIDAVTVTATEPKTPPKPPPKSIAASRRWPWILLALAVGALLFVAPLRREMALRREVRHMMRDATPGEIRARVEERVRIDIREASDRGDAWRALRSLLDAAEHERDIAIDAERDIARRLADVLRFTR